MKKHQITAVVCLVVAIAITVYTGMNFLEIRKTSEIIPGPGVTEQKMLSDYYPALKGTNGDTAIYIMKGEQPGGTVLVLGGTHANEPSGHMTAVAMVEGGKMEAGTAFVIPRANNSAFTHNDSQEGAPQYYRFTTQNGQVRTFRYGSRATNPIDQWPDPDVYIHAASGQRLSGSETRNLNRAYPGRPDGTLTEQIAYGIVQLINQEKVDMTFDLHEASPEYPVINATVSHEKGMAVASVGVMNLQLEGIPMALEPSPVNLRGLTHRELGDYTDTIPLLMETANPSQGRIRGKTSEYQVLTGKDKSYVVAAGLGMLYVPFDENGHPLEERVGRHMQGILEYTAAYSDQHPDRQIKIVDVPTYSDLKTNPLGNYLN